MLIVIAALLEGCSTIGYYSQAVGGHLKLMSAREPIEKLLDDDATEPELREKLQTLVDARVFAIEQLSLPDNDSYKTYVATGRDAVTWNVVAADEFSVQAKTWCFPVAGCVSYRGYFDKAAAQAYADDLAQESMDVSVGGASAYSTLGWFDDPVLDTMLRGGGFRYVSTLFHEMAHQVLYIKNDSNFNEAFASFVEQEGMRKWLDSRGGSDQVVRYNESLSRSAGFVDLLKETRESLQALYAQELPVETKRARKQDVFNVMLEHYEALKNSWGGYAGYDNWFKQNLNNARLVAVATYRRYIPAFESLYEEAGGDFAAFYELAKTVSELESDERRLRMESYLQ